MTHTEMIADLEAIHASIIAHPDCVEDSEFAGNAARMKKVINILKCYVGPAYPEPISGIQIGQTRTRILGYDYVVRGADWNTKEVVLTPVDCA